MFKRVDDAKKAIDLGQIYIKESKIEICFFRGEGQRRPSNTSQLQKLDTSSREGPRSCSISPQRKIQEDRKSPNFEKKRNDKKYSFFHQDENIVVEKKTVKVKRTLVLDKPTTKKYWAGKPKSYDHTRFNVYFRRTLKPSQILRYHENERFWL